jgi:plasmid stability protein
VRARRLSRARRAAPRYSGAVFIPPAGTTPLSAYTPPRPGALLPPPAILADRVDPITRDISSLLEGEDPTDAALQWAFTIRQGSGAALGDLGHRLHTIRKATDGSSVQAADEARRVLRRFVQRGDVRDVDVAAGVVGSSTATSAVVIALTNTRTGRALRQRVGGA